VKRLIEGLATLLLAPVRFDHAQFVKITQFNDKSPASLLNKSTDKLIEKMEYISSYNTFFGKNCN